MSFQGAIDPWIVKRSGHDADRKPSAAIGCQNLPIPEMGRDDDRSFALSHGFFKDFNSVAGDKILVSPFVRQKSGQVVQLAEALSQICKALPRDGPSLLFRPVGKRRGQMGQAEASIVRKEGKSGLSYQAAQFNRGPHRQASHHQRGNKKREIEK